MVNQHQKSSGPKYMLMAATVLYTFTASVCYVTPNICAKFFCVIYLTDPPEFPPDSVNKDVVVVEGDQSVTLECNPDGEPTPNVTWTKVYTNDSDSGVLKTGNQFVLETNRNNSGTYRCTAYNGIGTAPNRTVKVEVNCK